MLTRAAADRLRRLDRYVAQHRVGALLRSQSFQRVRVSGPHAAELRRLQPPELRRFDLPFVLVATGVHASGKGREVHSVRSSRDWITIRLRSGFLMRRIPLSASALVRQLESGQNEWHAIVRRAARGMTEPRVRFRVGNHATQESFGLDAALSQAIRFANNYLETEEEGEDTSWFAGLEVFDAAGYRN